ncbi:MAG: dihydroneopterin aldolase [Bacteroidales bacterium]|nr:dihydroneopterin aldolase [Bacteroidales bacterium]
MELSGLEFHAFHGCLEREKQEGNRFVVDFKAAYLLGKADRTDRLEDAADYGIIYEAIRKEMEQPSELLEHVARRIVKAVEARFPKRFPLIKVTVSKEHPPVEGPCEWSRITVFSRDPVFAVKYLHVPAL